jgi:hypothetical protein
MKKKETNSEMLNRLLAEHERLMKKQRRLMGGRRASSN